MIGLGIILPGTDPSNNKYFITNNLLFNIIMTNLFVLLYVLVQTYLCSNVPDNAISSVTDFFFAMSKCLKNNKYCLRQFYFFQLWVWQNVSELFSHFAISLMFAVKGTTLLAFGLKIAYLIIAFNHFLVFWHFLNLRKISKRSR